MKIYKINITLMNGKNILMKKINKKILHKINKIIKEMKIILNTSINYKTN
jgi:hypothetical protein